MMKGPYTFGEYMVLRLLEKFEGLGFKKIQELSLTIGNNELKQDLMSLSSKQEIDFKNGLWVKI